MAKGNPKNRDYEQLGRTIESVFAQDYVTRKKLYWMNFSRGIFFGLGVTIGGTVVIALLAWLLSFFTELPIVGSFVETIDNSINS